jgi:hypothetical protein
VEEQDEEEQLIVSEQFIRGSVLRGEARVNFLLLCSIVTVWNDILQVI